jgi:hypothetical protein
MNSKDSETDQYRYRTRIRYNRITDPDSGGYFSTDPKLCLIRYVPKLPHRSIITL